MIRNIFLSAIFCIVGISLYAQGNSTKNWFYNASITNGPRINQAILLSEKLLAPINSMFVVSPTSGDTCYIYGGKVEKSIIFNKYMLDSAVILSTCGTSVNSTMQAYKGKMNMLQVDYYLQDERQLNDLYQIATREFLGKTKKTDLKAGINTLAERGQLIHRTFEDNTTSFHKIEIWKFISKSPGVYRLRLVERASGN